MKKHRIGIYWNGCAALAACVIGMGWNSARAQQTVRGTIVEKRGGIVPSSKAPQQSPQPAAPAGENPAGVNLDIVGIKPGMTVKEAMIALRADNPRLMLTPNTHQYEGFADPLLLYVSGLEQPGDGRGSESIDIFFTMPPSQEVVWGVKRTYSFAINETPSMQNTLEALHKKYGPETVPADPDPRSGTKGIVWIYDAQGRPMGPRGAQLYKTCGSFESHFSGTGVVNDMFSGFQPGPAECKSYIVIGAGVVGGRDPAGSQMVVSSLIVSVADVGRYRTAIESTRTASLSATESREKKQSDDVNKRGAPKF